jgi:hypothetical protein
MSVEISAGPYELFNLMNKNDRITLAIMTNNEISWRKYKGNQLVK